MLNYMYKTKDFPIFFKLTVTINWPKATNMSQDKKTSFASCKKSILFQKLEDESQASGKSLGINFFFILCRIRNLSVYRGLLGSSYFVL